MLSALCSAMVMAGGCIYDFDRCAATEEGEDVKLRFTVVTRDSYGPGMRKTRAADIEEQEGSAPENYLNLAGRDIRFLLFDDEQKLLRDFTPDADITVAAEDDNRYITYTVHATIAEPYFANVATAETTEFYIMVIANCRPYSLSAFGLATGATTIENVAGQLASFTLKTYTDAADGPRTGWTPSQPGEADGEYIPMAGLQHFTLKQGAFGKGAENFVDLSGTGGKDINMLRALAKIEVIDKIDVTGNFAEDSPQRNVEVEKAELFGYCATGTILPSYEQWNGNVDKPETQQVKPETQQVVAPTMAKPVVYKAPNGNIEEPVEWDSEIDLHEDKDAQKERTDNCPVFSVYVPEYSLADIGNAVPPYIRLTVQDPDKPDETSAFYLLKLANYTDGAAEENIPNLLRNHIYRYEITAIRNNSLEIQYTLCPMGDGVAEIPPFN